MVSIRFVGADACRRPLQMFFKAISHNSKCRYGERGAAGAKPKAQIILDAAKVSAASGGNSEPKQGQRSQSARGFCPRSTMRVPQPDIIEHFGNADAMPQPPERCLSRKAGIVRCCLTPQIRSKSILDIPRIIGLSFFSAVFSLITPVFFQAIGAAKVSVAISVMREIICLIPIFWLLSRLGLGWTWWAFPLSETISGEFGLVLYLRQIHRWPDV